MKISQDNPKEFQPLTIVLETAREAQALFNIMDEVNITETIDYDEELCQEMYSLHSALYAAFTNN